MVLTDISDSMVERVDVSKSERLMTSSSSKGNQLKWKHGNIFVKLNLLGYEDKAEVMVSHFLGFTDLKEDEYVVYNSCSIYEDGVYLGQGCYSVDFVGTCTEVSVANILDDCLESYAISYDDLVDLLHSYLGYDTKPYIDKILSVDSICRNDDRHFRNILFLYNKGRYFNAPIFDNGSSCLSDLLSYPTSVDFNTNYGNVYAKPFYIDFKRNFNNNKPLVIDYYSFVNSVELFDTNSIRAFNTIKQGLKDMEGISWVRK